MLLAWTAVAGDRADFATAGGSHGIPLNASAVEKAGKQEAKEVRYALMLEECTEWTSQNYTDTARFASSHVQPEPGQGRFTGSIQKGSCARSVLMLENKSTSFGGSAPCIYERAEQQPSSTLWRICSCIELKGAARNCVLE